MSAAKTATISLKLPQDMKANFEVDCSSIGLSPSALLRSFIHYVTTRGRIPEEVMEPDPFYSAANRRWLDESQKQLDEGKYVSFTMEEFDAMMEKAIGNAK
jgi:antitoxin component of RelBE/YafQ-DinJ toxin-antitoxin module